MIYAALLLIMIYYTSFMIYLQNLLGIQGKSKWLYLLSTLILILAVYGVAGSSRIYWLSLPFGVGVMMIGLRLSARLSWIQAAYCANLCILSAYSFRGMFTALSAFLLQKRQGDLLLHTDFYYAVSIFAVPATLGFFLLVRKRIFTDQQIKRLLEHSEQLKNIVAYEVMVMIYFTIVNQGRYFSPNVSWFTGISLGASILTLGALFYSTYQSIKAIELMEYKWRSKALQEQFTRQLKHYEAYEEFTESYRTFKHDYRALMHSLKTLIARNENEQAIQLMESIDDSIQSQGNKFRTYSDNAVLDAMLHDLTNICKENQISLSMKVFAPYNARLSLLDAVRIFSNLTINAVEACCKLPVTERFIEVMSYYEQDWTTLQVTNSFDGHVIIQNGQIHTSKPDTQQHGRGIKIVNEIADRTGGFSVVSPDPSSKMFTFKVHIPNKNNSSRASVKPVIRR